MDLTSQMTDLKVKEELRLKCVRRESFLTVCTEIPSSSFEVFLLLRYQSIL